jgi:muramidase (phage lysozyme)
LVKKQWKHNAKNEYECLHTLWNKESGWRSHAANPKSTAFGIPQFLNSTWVNYGYPVRPKDPQIQIKAGLRYIYKRYSTPCKAWSFWKKQAGPDMRGGWY